MKTSTLLHKVYRHIQTLAALTLFLAPVATVRAATLVQEFYLPMPEAQIYQANNTIISGAGSTIDSTFSIVVTGNGTVIYYDQWEDGYETDLGNPAQSTTQIWGDGNDAHGIPPGFAHNPLGLSAGTVITLTNNVTQPRNPSTLLWDARDRIGANKALIISRAGWPTQTGPVFAGAVSVLSTIDYGTNYISPIGQNQTNVNLMKYVGMFIMASQNNTSVTIDPNGNGVGATNIVLNQGESYLVNGGIKVGGRVTSTKPIQAHLIIGHVGASYASDWFTLYPVASWSGSYYTPVGSASKVSQPAYVYLYNPGVAAITINYNTKVGSGSFSVPTNSVYQYQMPVGSGASFVSAGGQSFYALCTVAANNSSDTSYNWGFALVPQTALTTEADAGWAPGSADGTVNGSPVWVTALSNTKLYVDFKGDHSGTLTDPNGNQYDTNITVTALQSQKIFDPSKNQTGMRVYTVDGTLITAAWGEDPDTAQPGDPYIDAGTTVLPFPVPTLHKTAAIVTDVSPTGLSVGDTIQYSVQIDNKGLLPLGNTVVIDAPSGNLTYVPNTTTLNGTAIPDNAFGNIFPLSSPGYTIPVILSQGTSTFQYKALVNAGGTISNSVNIGGTTIFSAASISPPPTNGATVSLTFSDNGGVPVGSYSVGGNVFVSMTNAAGNTASNSVQTISVTVQDTNNGDLETIALTETGTNTGVFRNATGLPTSATSGLSQQDGTLNVSPGDTLKVSYTDPNFGDSGSATALISFPTPSKQLYLSVNGSTNGTQDLNRIDPVASGHTPTRTSIDIGSSSSISAWPYRQAITINHTNVFATDQTNFPILISLSGNTGLQNHAQASGNDILFTASDGSTILPYEREKYTNSTGALVAWVKVPLVSHTTNTVIYMYYGNSAALDQQNKTAVWDANFKIVYHLGDAGPTTALDSTTNGNNGTATGASFGATGEIGGAASFSNGNTTPVDYISASSSPGIGPNQGFSYEMWIKVTGTFANQTSMTSASGSWFLDRTATSNPLVGLIPVGSSQFGYETRYDDASGLGGPSGGTVSANWTHVVMVRDLGNSLFRLYVNGTQVGTSTDTGGALTPPIPKIGRHQSFTSNTPGLNGLIDEFRISGIARSAGWIQTEYTNQASPSTFFSVAAETTNVITATTNVTSFVQTPVFASPFTMPAGGTVTVTNYITITNGSLSSGAAVTATLQQNGTNFITLSNPTYTVASNTLVWTGVLSSNVAVPAGQAITCVISNNVPGTQFHINYDSTNAPSIIVLPASASTVIAVNTLGVYDAAYPGGNLITTPVAGSTVYVRANVTDPFGSYDITSLGLAVTGPSPATSFTNVLGSANVVTNDAASKTYEYPWATGPTTGGFSVAVTAHEGTEGVTAVAAASITTTFLDLGTPSTTTFVTGVNHTPTNSYQAGSSVCVSVSAPDSVTNAATIQTIIATITSSTGDSENVTLTETAANTGVYVGCINTSTNSGSATNNGTLYAPVGSLLTATYNDPNDPSFDSSATATIQPAPGVPGVTITKTIVSPTGGQVGIGQPVIYNLQVVNSGSTTLPNLSVSDTFSSGPLSYSSASLTPNTVGSGLLTWTNLGAMTPGQLTNITVTFNTLAAGSATNSATANGVSATNSSSVILSINRAALNVVKTLLSPGVQPVGVGSNVVFRVTVQNVGNTVVNYLPLEDTFSGAYYQFVSATIAPNGSGAGSLLWTNLAAPTPLATNAIITNDITMKVVGQGSPANNNATVDYATDVFGNAVPTSLSTVGVITASASINGHVYNDTNQSGVFVPGDTGLSGVTLQLFTDPNGDGNPSDGSLVQIVTTDGNGYYELLNLNSGHYVVVESLLPGYVGSAPANNRQAINVTNLTAYTNQNFFQYVPTPSVYSTISGTVWNDANANGTNNVGEVGIANVEIDLVQDANSNGVADAGEPVAASVSTSTNGNYSFAGITPGHYVIHEIDPFGYHSIADSQGVNDNQITFVSTTGIVSTNNNFYDRQSPTAVADTNSTIYALPVTINPLTNDVSPYGDVLTITNVTSPDGIVVIKSGSTNLTFTPTNSGPTTIIYTVADTHGGTALGTITVSVVPGTLTATASNASRPYGQPNPTFTGTLVGVTNGDSITATFASSATSNSPVGTYPIVSSLVDPNVRSTNYNVTLNNGTLTISKAASVVTWTNPVPVIYGTPLSSNQLNATATVPGTFVYLPTNGTVLNVGTNTLSVVFTPTDTVDYSPATNTVSLAVQPAPLSVTANNASRNFGQTNPVFSGILLGVTNGDNLTATYASTATSNSPAGTYLILSTIVDPGHRLTNYNLVSSNGTLTVLKIPAAVTWTNPLPVIYGTPLSSNQLNAAATVPGTFVYSPTNGTVLNVGTNTLSVVFTPTDTVDYNSATNTVSLVVQPAPLSVTANNASRNFGQTNPVFSGNLVGVVNSDNITATYASSVTSNSPVGTYSIIPTLVDPNGRLTNYNFTATNGTLMVLRASAVVTWTNPAPVIYGTPLGSNQLNAAATVGGTFVYTPTNSTVLNVGTNTLSVVFTPTDTVDYNLATNTVSLIVQPAPLTVTASNTSRAFGQPNPIFGGTLSGVTNGDNISATFASSATSNSAAGTYPIVSTLVDPNHRLTNYNVTTNNGTLTISSAGSLVTWTNPAPIIYGTPLSTNQLNATATVGGTFVYTPTNGTVLNVGTNILSVVFTPTDTVDYNSSTNTVTLVVQPEPLTVTASNVSRTYGQSNPVFGGTLTGVTNGDNITATFASSTTSNSTVGTYPIVPTLVDPNHRLTNYSATTNNGTLTIVPASVVITWTNPTPVVYGTPLGTNQLDASAPIPGTFTYSPTNGTVLNIGTNTLSVVFRPTDTNDYNFASNTVTLVVQPAPLSVTANNASLNFGQTNPVFSGNLVGVVNGDNITATYASSATSNSPVGTYSILPTLVDPNARLTNYNFTITNGTLTVLRASAVVTWTNPAPVIYGTALSSNQLNATATVGGTFVYSPTNGTVLNVGTNTLSVVFTPTDTVDYNSATNTVSLVVQPAPLSITANSASRNFGQTNPVFSGTILGVVNGDNITATYATSATTNSPAGNYSILPTPVDPNSRLTNYNLTLNNGTLTINSAGSLVSWPNPAPIIYGTSLSTNQLDATATVGGTFVYTPTNGAVLNVGTNTLSVVFTPTDTVDYNSATNTVSLVVQPAPLSVSANNASRNFGQANPVFNGTLLGVTNGDNITATYASAATSNSPAATYPIVPSLLDPIHRLTNYNVTTNNGVLTVAPASVAITWTNPAPIIYGTPLTTNQLDATAPIPGTFTYSPTNGTVPNVGTNTLSVVFTPTDTNDYNSASNTVTLVIQPAPLTVTASNASRTYGQPNPIFGGTLLGVTNGDNITATFASGATGNSMVGTYAIVPTLVDPNHRLTNYNATTNNGTLTIVPASVVISWTNPTPIIYGTPLSTNQLDATTPIPGTFTYSPTNGTVPNAGTNMLSVVFTPTDTNDYNPATNSVTVVVQPAPLSVIANNTSRSFGQTNPVFSGNLIGVVNGDNITATYASSATSNSPAGTYPIVPTLVDPNHRLSNYNVTATNGTLTVGSVSSQVTWNNPAPIIYGTPLSASQLNATATVLGTFAYTPAGGTVLDAGSHTLSAVFTPTDLVDYNIATNTVTLLVLPAPLTATANNASRNFGQPNPTFTGTLTGVTNGDNITATYASSAATNSPPGSYPITPTLVDPNHRATNYTLTSNNGTLTVQPVADVAIVVTAPTTVYAGSNLVYTITVTNMGPNDSSNVVVSDNLPGVVTFISTTGGGTNNGGVVTWPTIPDLTNGAAVVFSLTVHVPGTGSFTNTALSTSPTFDPNTSNNNGSGANSQAATQVVPPPVADIAVFDVGPSTVVSNQDVTYVITVTNMGPGTSTGVVLTDNLPTNVTFVSTTGGGANNSGVVTWNLGSLTNGQTTSVTVTVTAPGSGSFTNVASATSTTVDPNPANNNGSSGSAQAATTVATSVFGILAGTSVLNPQTGLFEEHVVVTNISGTTVAGVRLYVDGLRTNVFLYNASGTNAGRPYAQYNSGLNPNQTVTFLLEFYNPTRQPFTNSLDAEPINNPFTLTTNAAGSTAITRVFMDSRTTGQPRFVVEFASVPGKSYTIIYSDDNMVTWKVATPTVTAGSNSTQWYDDGPPETDSPPTSLSSRFYAIIANP